MLRAHVPPAGLAVTQAVITQSIDDLTPAIYTLQASGYVQILGYKTGEDFWNTLKHPIALGKMVVFQEQRMLVDKVIDKRTEDPAAKP